MRSDARIITEISAELGGLSSRGHLRPIVPSTTAPGAQVEMMGRRVVSFASWDFLHLAARREVRDAAHHTLATDGFGLLASRFCGGTSAAIIQCESALARFFACDSAVLVSSRNQAVLSLMSALVGEGDSVFVDDESSSPVADAAYLTNAQLIPYPLGDTSKLQSELERARASRRRIVFCEGVVPQTGALAPLSEIVRIAALTDASVIVDESFALAAVGARGAGACELAGCAHGVLAVFSDLSRGAGCYGACIAASVPLISYLIGRSPTFHHEIALPCPVAAGIATSLRIVELGTLTRARIAEGASRLATALQAMGYATRDNSPSPIVSVSCASAAHANKLAALLLERGFLCEALGGAALRRASGSVRIIVRAEHTDDQINALTQAFADLRPATLLSIKS